MPKKKLSELSENIAHLALPDSAVVIAKEVIKLAQQSMNIETIQSVYFVGAGWYRNECPRPAIFFLKEK